MKLNLKFLLVPMCLFAPAAAYAQFGVYGMFTESRLTGITGSPYLSPGVAYNPSVNPSGFTGGLFYDFRTYGPVRLGADVRGSITHTSRGAQTNAVGAGTQENSVLGGLRGSFHTPVKIIQPYVQASAGLGRSSLGILFPSPPTNTGNPLVSGFEYHVYAGADVHILPLVDFRAVELGYGGLDAGSHNYPIKSVSTGIVFHFPRLQ